MLTRHAASPTELPAVVSRHLAEGSFVPIWDGRRNLNVFVARAGFRDHSEETVLLLHSLPGSSLAFAERQRELAAAGLSSIAFDFPGFGLSDKPAGVAYGASFFASAVHEVLNALHVDAVHLYAEGTACEVAHAVAAKWPHVVSSLLLHRCMAPPTSPPPLALFVLEYSRALPLAMHRLLFGAPALPEESIDVEVANRWLTLYKSGHESYFAYCAAPRTEADASDYASTICATGNGCGWLGDAVPIDLPGFRAVSASRSSFGATVSAFVKGLPAARLQRKEARAKPRVMYTEPTGGDKYGLAGHDHGGHGHGDGHSHDHAEHAEHADEHVHDHGDNHAGCNDAHDHSQHDHGHDLDHDHAH